MHGAYELISSTSQSESSAREATVDTMLSSLTHKSEKLQQSPSHLPSHLQLSYDHTRNPWQNLFMQDFILMAEFCEHEGPKPLFTIPEYAGEVFNKNAFSVHVMSVDYQTQSSNSLLVDDTQLVFLEDRENIFAYVHHFILYDIDARGFVRPFCMCYISNSKKKILSNLENFFQEFSKISSHFKDANKPVFYKDLKQRLSDLNYMKDFFLEFNDSRNEDGDKTKNLCGLNAEAIDSMLIDTGIAIKALETNDSVIKKLIDNYIYTDLDDLQNDETNFDEVVQRILRERRRSTLTLRDVHKLCNSSANHGLSLLQKLHQNFYQMFEVFTTIKEETACVEPISSALTIGGSFVMNFGNNVKIPRTEPIVFPVLRKSDSVFPESYHSANSVASVESFQSCEGDEEERSTEGKRPMKENSLYVSTPLSKVTVKDLLRSRVPPSKETNMTLSTSDTHESTSTSEHTEEDIADVFTLEGAFVSTDVVRPPQRELGKHSYSTGELQSLLHGDNRSMKRQLSVVETKKERLKTKNIDVPRKEGKMIAKDDFFLDIRSLCTTPRYTVIYRNLCEVNDGFDALFVQSYTQQLSRRKEDGPGGGVLRVLWQYSYLVHLLFALLCGRTVVVLGEAKHKKRVQMLITALWLFVPGNFRGDQQVVLWREKPLVLADLGRFKLVGLCKLKKRKVLPSSVETHVTTLDFESGCLNTPSYQGEFLNEMLASRRCWKTDTVFMSYVHSIYLEMSLKAFVCYYTTILETCPREESQPRKNVSFQPRKFSTEHMNNVLDSLGILGSDAKIILYFIDLLVRQQTAEYSIHTQYQQDEVSRGSNSSLSSTSSCEKLNDDLNRRPRPRPIVLDFSVKSVFRNRGSSES